MSATPRPWTRHDYRVFREDPPTQRLFKEICFCAWNAKSRTPEAEANAALIVTAVNAHERLLEAVELFLTALPADMSMWRELGLDTSRLTMARLRGIRALAIIAQASPAPAGGRE